jgi:hypothetical protein
MSILAAVAVGGAILGGVNQIVGSDAERKNRNRQENLARQKSALYDKLTASNLLEASKSYKQTEGANILSQSLSGVDLNSETFQKLNQQVYGEYLRDVERINLQGDFYKLGVESEIAGIQAQKPTTIGSALSFLSSATQGANTAMQFAGIFGK